MIDPDEFESVAAALGKLNALDEASALEAMELVGDTPLLDAEGRAVVTLADGRELRLVLPT